MTKDQVKKWVDEQKGECIEKDNNSIIKFEENRKIVLFLNDTKKEYYRIQVDGCLITEGVRCDCILLDSENGRVFYVELKGIDTPHAIEQLKSTSCRVCPDRSCRRVAMVVGKNHLPQATLAIQKGKKELSKLGVELLVLNSAVRYDLSKETYQQNL